SRVLASGFSGPTSREQVNRFRNSQTPEPQASLRRDSQASRAGPCPEGNVPPHEFAKRPPRHAVPCMVEPSFLRETQHARTSRCDAGHRAATYRSTDPRRCGRHRLLPRPGWLAIAAPARLRCDFRGAARRTDPVRYGRGGMCDRGERRLHSIARIRGNGAPNGGHRSTATGHQLLWGWGGREFWGWAGRELWGWAGRERAAEWKLRRRHQDRQHHL